jgi:Protein of unknown function (DUF3754)
MAEYADREHYIPLRKSGLDRAAAGQFRAFSELISATFHYEYHKLLEELKDAYAPFDPDTVTEPIKPIGPEGRAQKLDRLLDRFTFLMERANFIRLSRDDILQAVGQVSDWGVDMDVDLSIFDRLEIFARGDGIGTRYIRRMSKLWRREPVKVPVYRRLVLLVKLKPSSRLPEGIDTDDVFLKAFKEIPKADLEMLLPGARLRMPGFHRLKLGGSVVTGGAWISYTVGRQVMETALTSFLSSPMLVAGPAMALFGYGYKQYYGYQSTRNVFHLRLTQSLYYQTIGNNLGVLFHLLDEAEEQELREALLAYYYLWRQAGPNGWPAKDLDDYVEMDLERLAHLKVDFEIDDALAKLERLKLVTRQGDRYAAVPIEKALEALDYAWDNYFEYNKAGQEG